MTFSYGVGARPTFRATPEGPAPAIPGPVGAYATPGAWKRGAWSDPDSLERFLQADLLPFPGPPLAGTTLAMGAGVVRTFPTIWRQDYARRWAPRRPPRPALEPGEHLVGEGALEALVEAPGMADASWVTHPIAGLRVVSRRAGVTGLTITDGAMRWRYVLAVQ